MVSEVKAVRLQLSRKKGFNLQQWSREVNGLPAVNVARPSRYGNPYRVGTCLIPDAQAAVEAFAANLPLGDEWLAPLRGKNLACFCKLTDACHANVLLRLASAPEAKAA